MTDKPLKRYIFASDFDETLTYVLRPAADPQPEGESEAPRLVCAES